MRVRENHPCRSQRVCAGRIDLASLGRQAIDVTVAKIVTHHKHDVRTVRGQGKVGKGCDDQDGEKVFHVLLNWSGSMFSLTALLQRPHCKVAFVFY